MIAPKSAIDAAATMSWPKGDEISPVSFSTGTITPSDVAQRMIATSSGVWTSPAADSPKPTTTAIAKETTNAERRQAQDLSAQLLELDLEAREEQHEAKADQRQDLDHLVDLDDAEQRRTHHDAGDDLEHHRRQPDTRKQAEQERGREGHRDDDEEIAERRHASDRRQCGGIGATTTGPRRGTASTGPAVADGSCAVVGWARNRYATHAEFESPWAH